MRPMTLSLVVAAFLLCRPSPVAAQPEVVDIVVSFAATDGTPLQGS